MKFLRAICLALALLCYENSNALSVVRDAEIEEILTEFAQSLFKVAKLDPKTAKVYVIDSPEINAFTIGNGFIFINSGTLLRFSNPLEIFAILAHETAHIAAGHINRLIHVLQQRSENFSIAMLAGILGAAITGSEEAIAILLGYAMTDDRMYLHYSRGEEMAADALGAEYMKKLGYGVVPMMSVFEYFKQMEIMNGSAGLPIYVRSHPKSSDRIDALRRKNSSSERPAQLAKLTEKYHRVQIKLKAYLGNGLVETSDKDAYSKAVLYHRTGRYDEAISILRDLLKKNPHDKYYKETLAQIFYENGNLEESIKLYSQIYANSSNILIKIAYARALIAANKKIDLAIRILESAKYQERFESEIYRLLGKAYGMKKREGVALYFLAQEQMVLRCYAKALELIKQSLTKLNPKTEQSYIKKAKELEKIVERMRRE